MTDKVLILHKGDSCPIPDRKAGEYGIKWKGLGIYEPTCDAIHVEWGRVEGVSGYVIAYYLVD